ncbi:RNA polymerase II transcription factor SIII subunit A2, partial [Cricetulus griseus]
CARRQPRQLYKTLKKLSSQPMLGDILEETGFRQSIKLLKNQQFLVPFAKELAARWSEKFTFGPQPLQDFAFHRNSMTEIRSNSPEDKPHKPVSQGHREDGRQVCEVSSSIPQHSATQSIDTSSKQIQTRIPNAEPAGRKTQRESFRDPHLDKECQWRVSELWGSPGLLKG